MLTVAALNLALLAAFPVTWFLPLMRAGVLPLFGAREITIVSALQSLWRTDVVLALVVTALAIVAPMLKTLALALLHAGLLDRRTLPAVTLLGRLAMADVFLAALYIVVAKGVGLARIEVAWGLYAFTACVLASLVLSLATARLWR
ncbi:MAG: paraquat-inducible protein A [Gemmobacter sp.]